LGNSYSLGVNSDQLEWIESLNSGPLLPKLIFHLLNVFYG
jgi:hypothetical protein